MIRISHLSKTYSHREREVLRDVSFELPDTGFVCIVGASGCGKTSLLNAIGCLDKFDSGTVSTQTLSRMRCGKRSTELERSRSFGYIFQNYYLLQEHSVAYNVFLGLHALDLSYREKLQRVHAALQEVDMDRFARRRVSDLSGGQQQRVAIARALARRPRVIFADEPTGNLDQANTINICNLLRDISRHSLVVMVTHEEQIARFYADRIITLKDGEISSDSSEWVREEMLSADGALYAGDYDESAVQSEGLELRLLREEGAEPIAVTILALKDRIVIKLDDSRSISCSAPTEAPTLREGKRPTLSIEAQKEGDSPKPDETPTCRVGKGISAAMIWQEGRRLLHAKGFRRVGMRIFLIALTLLTLLTTADYLMIATIRPEDFITTDSHILEIELTRGEGTQSDVVTLRPLVREFTGYLNTVGLDFDYIPQPAKPAYYETELFRQMGDLSLNLSGFSYSRLSRLDENDLIYGRMPNQPDEIVVDRRVLEKLISSDGILQSGIEDVSYFIGERLHYQKMNIAPEIVGICDSGEPTLYLSTQALASIGASGNELITLSDLYELGEYENYDLTYLDCLIVTNNAGAAYASKIGGAYNTKSQQIYTIRGTVEADTYASMVIADEYLEHHLQAMLTGKFFLYCEDKAAVREAINAMPEELAEQIQVYVTDRYSADMNSYRASTQTRLDARTIVTLTVILLCFVMLYLLQRSVVRENIGMICVYRLLGIPKRKLMGVFATEAALIFLTTTLPTGVLTYLTIAVLSALPSVEISLLLPWQAAALVTLAVGLCRLLLSVLPLLRLLRQPPARLASKFDF